MTSYFIVVTVDASHRPVEFFHLHAGIADYFHHGRQPFPFFHNLRKRIKSAVTLYAGISPYVATAYTRTTAEPVYSA